MASPQNSKDPKAQQQQVKPVVTSRMGYSRRNDTGSRLAERFVAEYCAAGVHSPMTTNDGTFCVNCGARL
jgi:hypothetical protein